MKNIVYGIGRKEVGRAQHNKPTEDSRSRKQRVRNAISRFDFDVEDYISVGLAGKVKVVEAKLAAIELGFLINSYAYKNGATVKERAVNREIGQRLAEHIAHIFFDDPDEEDEFMEGIRSYVEKDMLLEMGYFIRRGNSCYPTELYPDPANSNPGDIYLRAETIATFRANEQAVADAMNEAISSLTDEIVADKVALFIEKFNLIRNTVNDDIMGDIQRILEIQQTA